ncbi:MAG: thioredoxin domain-containing protein [Immundisolibacteraceae bacterium]|nr:thioredoxin domain-containing protein [Immundisolibacteraceae bacterium]
MANQRNVNRFPGGFMGRYPDSRLLLLFSSIYSPSRLVKRLSNVTVVAGLIGLVGLFGLVSSASLRAATSSAEPATVDWQLWDKHTFAKAKTENKLIFVNVGTEWCTACKWMQQITLTDPAVIDRLKKDFISIAIDAEAQPDIGERYAAWGWPALIFLNPDGGQVKAIRGNKVPKNFIPVLDQLSAAHHLHKLSAEDSFPQSTSNATDELVALRDAAATRLDKEYDSKNSGWGGKAKSSLPAAVQYALWRSHITGDSLWLDRALQTLTRSNDLIDPVWGGMAAATLSGDNPDSWKAGVIPEKKTVVQAGALLNYAEAYQRTGDKQWLLQATGIVNYLNEFVRSPQGAYYASQDGSVNSAADGISPSATETREGYYALNDQQRRKIGLPHVDKTIYGDINGRLISALVQLFEASGDVLYLQQAEQIGDYLATQHLLPDGWFAQSTQDPAPRHGQRNLGRLRDLPNQQKMFLRTQAHIGQGMLALFKANGNPNWLRRADKLAESTISYLMNLEQGGFYSTPLTKIQLGEQSFNYRPFVDNAVMANFLVDLAGYVNKPVYVEISEKALRSISAPEVIAYEGRYLGEYLLAIDKLIQGNVIISVVTTQLNQATHDLHQSAMASYEPAKILRIEKPGKYPATDNPALYACTDQICTQPIYDPKLVAGEISKFREKLRTL